MTRGNEKVTDSLVKRIYNSKIVIEIRRLWVFVLFTLLMLAWDTNRPVVLFAVAITTGTIALAHITRKLLFKYVDMRELVNKSLESPVASAVVFAAMIYLLSVVIQSTVVLLK